jgi:uncharacterized protein (TIGR00369 family)
MTKKQIDVAAARLAFESALESHEQAFGTFFLARLLGFEIDYGDDVCRVAFDVHDFMFNPQGSLHGGVIALAMDVSMGHLLKHLQGPGATLEMKTQYLAPVRGGRIRAEGRVLRRGRSVWFLESRLFDADGEPAAFATSTWKVIRTG